MSKKIIYIILGILVIAGVGFTYYNEILDLIGISTKEPPKTMSVNIGGAEPKKRSEKQKTKKKEIKKTKKKETVNNEKVQEENSTNNSKNNNQAIKIFRETYDRMSQLNYDVLGLKTEELNNLSFLLSVYLDVTDDMLKKIKLPLPINKNKIDKLNFHLDVKYLSPFNIKLDFSTNITNLLPKNFNAFENIIISANTNEANLYIKNLKTVYFEDLTKVKKDTKVSEEKINLDTIINNSEITLLKSEYIDEMEFFKLKVVPTIKNNSNIPTENYFLINAETKLIRQIETIRETNKKGTTSTKRSVVNIAYNERELPLNITIENSDTKKILIKLIYKNELLTNADIDYDNKPSGTIDFNYSEDNELNAINIKLNLKETNANIEISDIAINSNLTKNDLAVKNSDKYTKKAFKSLLQDIMGFVFANSQTSFKITSTNNSEKNFKITSMNSNESEENEKPKPVVKVKKKTVKPKKNKRKQSTKHNQRQNNYVKQTKKSPEYKKALRWFNKNQYDKSLKLLLNIIKNEPGNTEAYFTIGYIYLSKKDYSNSNKFFKKTMKSADLKDKIEKQLYYYARNMLKK